MNTFIKTLVVISLLFPVVASAATTVVEIDTGKEEINALEGTLVLPENMVVRKIQTGNSVISLWIEKPHQREHIIMFAGITPGGFTGAYPIFTISGEFDTRDLERIQFESVNALKNDGSGTSVGVSMSLSPIEMKADTEPPEDFTPVIASDPSVFDGEYFLVFATQDTGSGIARYEVREGTWGWFREAESPYLLKHQQLDRDVYVKAIDSDGHERVAVLEARVHRAWWVPFGLFAILIVFILVVVAYKKAWLRFIR